MKSKAIICAIAISSMGVASLSFAQGYDRRGGPGERPGVYQRDQGSNGREVHRDDDRRDGRNDQYDGRNNARYERQYGARGPEYHRGGRIPSEYRNRQYVVNDWRGHQLSAPPRGHQWVQVGADYALIAIATGVIAQLVLSH